jgi:hypothetical protein
MFFIGWIDLACALACTLPFQGQVASTSAPCFKPTDPQLDHMDFDLLSWVYSFFFACLTGTLHICAAQVCSQIGDTPAVGLIGSDGK